MGWTTSASRRKVTVSDQLRAETLKWRRSEEKPSVRSLVNGHGPAIQETRALRNSLPSPASSEREPTLALHFPSGEQGAIFLHSTFPVLTISNVLTALPIFASVVAFMEYLIRVLEIGDPTRVSAGVSLRMGTICSIYILSPIKSFISSGS